ncbi:hypothetical protein EDD18DRAFT_1306014 [Armillaria luteobubalina]|uniref:RNase H type-1 domain-containing protein n=1 Tax=Armillaria luteobubalina TaxID=153913 RepID=A0AA39UUX3_9AGAR|nr:hypothetical protein EDD18DRAFT_1306014 [Armillaria luteobubalina]
MDFAFLPVFGTPAPNQQGEIIGMIMKEKSQLHIQMEVPLIMAQQQHGQTLSDSKYVIEGLCFHLKKWEDQGWIRVPNSELWKAMAAILCQHGAPVLFKWVKGHNGDVRNEGVDALVSKGALLDIEHAVQANVNIDHEFDVVGAWLSSVTQSQAYKLIWSRTEIRHRPSAQTSVERVLETVSEINGVKPVEARLRRSIQHKDMSRPIRGFLWKVLQNTFKIGAFWERLGPQYAIRGECPHCKVLETMEHILLECDIAGQALIWDLMRELWEKKGQTWITPTYGLALGVTLIQIQNGEGKINAGATRLYKIIMTEATHMIWKIRCQRRIQRGDDNPAKWHTNEEIQNWWTSTMNQRLTIDCLLTNSLKYGKKAIKKQAVIMTWKGAVYNEKALPEDWTTQNRVLVGMMPGCKRPQGQH